LSEEAGLTEVGVAARDSPSEVDFNGSTGVVFVGEVDESTFTETGVERRAAFEGDVEILEGDGVRLEGV